MTTTVYNNMTQTLNIPYTLIQPVIPGKQIAYETPEQLAIQHYESNRFIIYHSLYQQRIPTYHNTQSRQYTYTH